MTFLFWVFVKWKVHLAQTPRPDTTLNVATQSYHQMTFHAIVSCQHLTSVTALKGRSLLLHHIRLCSCRMPRLKCRIANHEQLAQNVNLLWLSRGQRSRVQRVLRLES